MNVASEATNKALVLVALDAVFNKRDYRVVEQYWVAGPYVHCAHIAHGRDGLFEFVETAPATLRYEPGVIVANEDYVIVHGRRQRAGVPLLRSSERLPAAASQLSPRRWTIGIQR